MALPPFDAHPDVISVMAVLEGLYLWAVFRVGPRVLPPDERPATRRQVAFYSIGVLLLLLATEWPLHDLAEHYLFSAHMLEHTVISLVAPPLMLLGMPSWLLRTILRPRPLNWIVRNLARPFVALVIFNAVIVFTHWPMVMDTMLQHHSLHFAGHVLLFLSAVLMWWPVVSPLPEMPTLSYPGRMLYLFLQSIVPTVPASFLTFGSTPLYSFYSHVPRIWGLSVITDQRIAGLMMKLLGGAILWGVATVLFFKWYRIEHDSDGWDELAWRDVERQMQTGLREGSARR